MAASTSTPPQVKRAEGYSDPGMSAHLALEGNNLHGHRVLLPKLPHTEPLSPSPFSSTRNQSTTTTIPMATQNSSRLLPKPEYTFSSGSYIRWRLNEVPASYLRNLIAGGDRNLVWKDKNLRDGLQYRGYNVATSPPAPEKEEPPAIMEKELIDDLNNAAMCLQGRHMLAADGSFIEQDERAQKEEEDRRRMPPPPQPIRTFRIPEYNRLGDQARVENWEDDAMRRSSSTLRWVPQHDVLRDYHHVQNMADFDANTKKRFDGKFGWKVTVTLTDEERKTIEGDLTRDEEDGTPSVAFAERLGL